MRFLGSLESFVGVLHGLSGMLVPGLVILFVVMRGGSAVGVCGGLVKFRGSNVGIFCHCFSVLSSGANSARIHSLSCSIVHRRSGQSSRAAAQT